MSATVSDLEGPSSWAAGHCAPDLSAVTEVSLSRLCSGVSPRLGPLRSDHVEALMSAPSQWPPILVHRHSLLVIDGHHRVAAARLLGATTILARYFEGDRRIAEIEAVRQNIAHGLPLTLVERRSAAGRVLQQFPLWSDARIAAICGLSPKTIGSLRRSTENGRDRVRVRRIGRDGKSRPANPAALREEVAKLLISQPGWSLRRVAAEVGASKETVRLVKKRMETGEDDLGADRADVAPGAVSNEVWSGDSACSSTAEGQSFALWFDAHSVDDVAVSTFVDSVPLSRIYAVMDESRRRARFWSDYAAELTRRVR